MGDPFQITCCECSKGKWQVSRMGKYAPGKKMLMWSMKNRRAENWLCHAKLTGLSFLETDPPSALIMRFTVDNSLMEYLYCMPKTILKAFMWASLVGFELCQFKPLSIHEKFCNLHAMLLIMAAQMPHSPAIIQVCIKLSSHSNLRILIQQSSKVCRPKPFVAVLLTPNPTSHQFPCVRRVSLFVMSGLF